MRNYQIYLKDILSAINSIEGFVEEMSLEDLKNDDKTSSAVIRKLEIIGEATKNIPKDIKNKNPEIPWKEMAGMRDKLIHFYFGVDHNLVWNTIKERIPKIKPFLENILK
jgi:uncharacterized protein with HEPN domain